MKKQKKKKKKKMGYGMVCLFVSEDAKSIHFSTHVLIAYWFLEKHV